jgi:hypothetical protein
LFLGSVDMHHCRVRVLDVRNFVWLVSEATPLPGNRQLLAQSRE